MAERIYRVADVTRGLPPQATKTVLYENERTNGVIWYVPPGEEVPAHYHPDTDDIWIVLQGQGEYYLGEGRTCPLEAGMVAVAAKGEVHGVRATGAEPLVFAAISAPMPVQMIKV
ncbi:MAG: cupin domain-containing protein [Clostridia bacterium]|nr:cupin domain-containing protein [Clostridia bacterium]